MLLKKAVLFISAGIIMSMTGLQANALGGSTSSTEIAELRAGSSVETAQGFCMWSKDGHDCLAAAWIDENHGSYKSYLTVYDLTADKELSSLVNYPMGHANDMTRDPMTGHIYVAAGDGSAYDVLEFDEDLDLVGGHDTGTLSGICYDAYSDTFFLAGGRYIRQVDRDFNEIASFQLEKGGRSGSMVTYQGVVVFKDYILTIGAAGQGHWDAQDINVFDKEDGSLIASYDCDVDREVESCAYWNGSLYCTGNLGSRIRVYQMEVPGITDGEGAFDEEVLGYKGVETD